MLINEEKTFTIDSAKYWNDINLNVVKGEVYIFIANGEWTDWFIKCSADGYERFWLKPFISKRRYKSEKLFTLIGSINKTILFPIDLNKEYHVQESGSLYFFANDLPGFYWNNKGFITLIIKRLK